MQNMVKRIVEMDEHARKLTDEAKRLKSGSATIVTERKEELSREYQEKVNARLEVIKQNEMKTAEGEIKAIEEKHKELEKNLNAMYEEHCDEWVDEIVSRVVSGAD